MEDTAQDMRGWVKLPRDLIDSPILRRAPTMAVYIRLLLEANFADSTKELPKQRVNLKRGQVATSLDVLALSTGLSRAQVRRTLTVLSKRSYIDITTSLSGSIITVLNYDGNTDDENNTSHKLSTHVVTKVEHDPATSEELRIKNKNKNKNIYNQKGDQTPYEEIQKRWNDLRGGMPAINTITTERRRHLKARWLENPSLEYWESVFKRFSKNYADNDWMRTGSWATFSWLIKNGENHLKVMEGNYDDPKQKANEERERWFEEWVKKP